MVSVNFFQKLNTDKNGRTALATAALSGLNGFVMTHCAGGTSLLAQSQNR